jgi:hypothetical protein
VNGSGISPAISDQRSRFDLGVVGDLSDGELLDRFIARRDESLFEYEHDRPTE